MRKNYLIKSMLSLMLMMITSAALAQTSVTFTTNEFTTKGVSGGGSPISGTVTPVTISDPSGYAVPSAEVRLYAGFALKVDVTSGYKITGVEINATSTTYNGGTITPTTGTVALDGTSLKITWTPNAGDAITSVSLTNSKQIRANNIIVTYVSTGTNNLTATTTSFGTSSKATINVAMGESFTSPKATLYPSEAGSITYSSSSTSVATVDGNTGEVSIVGPGTTTITASFTENSTYAGSSDSYTLNVGKTTTTFPASTYNAFIGESFTSPTATVDNGGSVTYSSSATGVATVDPNTGAVTLVAPGTVTITASYAGDANYAPSSASYTLTVGKVFNNIQELQAGATTTLTKAKITFTNVSVTGIKNGSNFYISDGVYGATVNSTSTVTKGQVLNGTFTADVQLSSGATTIKNFLKSSVTVTDGTLTPVTTTIPEIQIANQGRYVTLNNVTFNATAKTFTDASNRTIANYAGLQTNPTLVDGVTYNITGVANAYNTSVEIMPEIAEALPASASISAAGYATFVAPFDINATAADVTVYTINTVSSASATLTPVTLIPKDAVVILKGAQGTHSLSSDATQTYTALTGNLLKAAPAGGLTILDTDNIYLLGMPSGQPVGFYRSTAGTLAAGKGYLDGGSIAAGKFLSFTDETTGIDKVNTTTIENNAIYNLNGQKISSPLKGINIINGKKVVIK